MMTKVIDPLENSHSPGLLEIFREFFVIGAVSFGGGILAYERILLVEKHKWLSADQFMAFLTISQTIPGLNSVNLAVLAGDFLRGFKGSLIATLALILPGSCFVLFLAFFYVSNVDHPLVNTLLVGVAAGATGLLTSITYRLGEGHWTRYKSLLIIGGTFVLMTVLHLSLVMVLLVMTPIAIYLYRPRTASK